MMYIIIAAIFVALVALVFKRKLFGAGEANFLYKKAGDPDAQVDYDKEKGMDVAKLSAKELLELSWKFLYDMTELVMYKFSATARKAVHDCGDVLVKHGMRYTHVVDSTPVRGTSRGKSIDDRIDGESNAGKVR